MKFELDLFKIDHNKIKPSQGKVLISGPFLNDMHFSRSIVLLTEHNEEGTVGFVLNKEINFSISDLIQGFPEYKTVISLGGPVSTNTVHYIHTLGEKVPNSVHIMENLYWGGDLEVLKLLIEKEKVKQNQIRFFVGYSGWTPDQLEREISENSWVVTELNTKQIMSYNENIWKDALSQLGEKFKIWENFPENPGLN